MDQAPRQKEWAIECRWDWWSTELDFQEFACSGDHQPFDRHQYGILLAPSFDSYRHLCSMSPNMDESRLLDPEYQEIDWRRTYWWILGYSVRSTKLFSSLIVERWSWTYNPESRDRVIIPGIYLTWKYSCSNRPEDFRGVHGRHWQIPFEESGRCCCGNLRIRYCSPRNVHCCWWRRTWWVMSSSLYYCSPSSVHCRWWTINRWKVSSVLYFCRDRKTQAHVRSECRWLRVRNGRKWLDWCTTLGLKCCYNCLNITSESSGSI